MSTVEMEDFMGKFFGTDGIRGVANQELTPELAFRVGQAAAFVLTKELKHRARIYIGKDTRISSDMLECALAAGISSVGAEVGMLGFVPTPAVAYLTVKHNADAGIVVSASHNPMEFNGIKIFNSQGYKLSDELELEIEEYLTGDTGFPTCIGGDLGRVQHKENAVSEYIEYVASTVDGDLSGLKVLIDCANGAASHTARSLFEKLGAECDFIFDTPDGVNINANCGSTKMDTLREKVVAGKYDVGVAFDGDADRCLIVDEKGNVVDGDSIMAVCACDLKEKGRLNGNSFVATVMSNLGLHAYSKKMGINVACSAVGDRNVLELMLKEDYVLGGEQSGHVIFREYSTTGDGELTAVQFLSLVKRRGIAVSELCGEIPQYPQVIINVKVANVIKDSVINDREVKLAIRQVTEQLMEDGRILVRPSGTEPLIRVMVEGRDFEKINQIASHVSDVIASAARDISKKM